MLQSIIPSALALLSPLSGLASSVPSSDNTVPRSTSATDADTFDYIVVGSGPGGGPLAVNLAEAGYSVLLLEAGQNLSSLYSQEIPAFFGEAQWDNNQVWHFYTQNYDDEEQSAKSEKMVWEKPDGGKWVGLNPPPGSKQLGIWYPRAGVLGGCDTHNGGLTVLPSAWDWDDIVAQTGDDSWTHDKMRDIFIKLERNLIVPRGTPGHGFDGYQPVGRNDPNMANEDSQVIAVAKGAAIAIGHPERASSDDFDVLATRDINAANPLRDFENDQYQISTKLDEKGRRASAASRVNQGIAKGLPLTVRFNSLVTKVVLDDDLKATSVDYLEGQSLYKADARAEEAAKVNGTGVPRSAKAKREIIISGGTFNTPQILQLSGIGDAEELAKHNIPVVVDLPGVGRNLQDHYEVPVMHQLPNNFTYWDECATELSEDGVSNCYKEWLANGTGKYSTLGFFQFILYTSSVAPRGERDLILYGASSGIIGHVPPYINRTDIMNAQDLYTLTVSESHSRNRAGNITLRSTDPRDTPIINFNYWRNGGEEDIQGLIDGIEFTRKVFDSIPGGTEEAGYSERYPGRDKFSTHEQLTEFVKAEAFGHHASGTAAIGGDDNPLAVLDSSFRVRGGVKGLRVVDASVFPTVPGTFPIIAVFLISEKASAAILADAEKWN